MFKTKAVFERKPVELYQRDCIVEKLIVLTDPEFEQYNMDLMKEQTFLQENARLMSCKDGIYHCLLVLGEKNPDGILIEAEGYTFARYAAFLPNARMLVEIELQKVAEYIIQEGTENTLQGCWNAGFDGLEERFGYKFTEDRGFEKMLLEILVSRPEVSEAEMYDNHFELTFYLDFCRSFQEQNANNPVQPEFIALRSLCEKLTDCVDHIVQDAMEAGQPEYFVPYEKVSEETGINVEFNDAILSVIQEMFLERPELSALVASETGFHMTVIEQRNSRERKPIYPRLQDLLECEWEDIHLVHDEIDNDPATIVELSNTTLTDAGRAAWADVLNAGVKRIFTGIYGMQMQLTGVKASRLDAFSHMLAGYCSTEDYDRWVVNDEEPGQQIEQSCSE